MNRNPRDPREPDSSRRFAERLAEHYLPEPFGPAERARFDAGLRERITRRRRAGAWMPTLVGATAVLALIWWIGPAATPMPPDGVDAAARPAGWEADVLRMDAEPAEEDYLPGEYEAIALAFLEGV